MIKLKTFRKFILPLLLFPALVWGQGKGETEFSLHLRDGNVITGTSNIDEIKLETKYGKLLIPIKNVSSIELGIPEADNEKEIMNLIKQLSASDESMRKSAYESLVGMDIVAIPVIEDYMFSEDYEPSPFDDNLLQDAINELKAIHQVEDVFNSEDIVSIDYKYTMGGKYDFDKIKLKTKYGNLTIPKSKIKKIDITYHSDSDGRKRSFKLIASKHISGNKSGGWLKTGIMVKQGQMIRISASGEISLASLSGNKYNPDGTVNSSSLSSSSSTSSTYPTYGNLIYKIGSTGQMKKAGSKFKGVAEENGMLYLSIYETVYNQSNTGYYSVNVEVY